MSLINFISTDQDDYTPPKGKKKNQNKPEIMSSTDFIKSMEKIQDRNLRTRNGRKSGLSQQNTRMVDDSPNIPSIAGITNIIKEVEINLMEFVQSESQESSELMESQEQINEQTETSTSQENTARKRKSEEESTISDKIPDHTLNQSSNHKRTKNTESEEEITLLDIVIYIKGKHKNLAGLAKARPTDTKKAINSIGLTTSIQIAGESLRVTCINHGQKLKFLTINNLMDIEVEITEPYVNNKNQNRDEHMQLLSKGVILGVPIDISIEDIKEETRAIYVQRITKHNGSEIINTTVVILGFKSDEEKPDYVEIGFGRHKIRDFRPMPFRCTKCQSLRHKTTNCNSEIRCPRCGLGHEFMDCPKKTYRKKHSV